MLRKRSIRVRLVLLVAFVVTLFYGCFGVYLYFGFRSYLVHALREILARRAHQIAATIVAEIPQKGEAYVAAEVQARYAPELNERLIRILDEAGRTIYVSSNIKELPAYRIPPGAIKGTESPPVSRELAGLNRQNYEMVVVAYRTTSGVYRVEVGAPENHVEMELRGLIFMLSFGFPLFLLLTSAGAYILVGRALHPVDEIVRSAESITGQNLSGRLPVPPTGDEVERLSLALNRMIQRLDEAIQQAIRFSGDASHELRTPLTIMRGELESLLQEEGLTPAQQDQLGSVLEETERLTQIVQGLLAMSRLEGGGQLKTVRLDFSQLVLSTTEQMEPLAMEKAISFQREVADAVFVNGDEMRLQQVVVNVLDNAIKYTPREGRIEIILKQSEGRAMLEVKDSGVGVNAEALPHIFERFYRSPQASSVAVEGTGLGLAMVKSIVEAHGGFVTARSQENQGTSLYVYLVTVA